MKLNSLEIRASGSFYFYSRRGDKNRKVRILDQAESKMALQQPIWNPILPFTGPILGGISEGKMIIIQGQVRNPAKSFVVNLMCQNGNIAFHFNPRFNEGRVVVCNTQEKGRWGPEQRASPMPFQPGLYFEIIINVKSHCYQVSVNGSHFLEYNHRLPFHLVQTLHVNGDISLNCINFVANSAPPPYLPPAPPPYNVITATNVGGMFAQPFFGRPSASQQKKSKTAQGFSGVTLTNPAVPFHVAIPGNFTQFRKIAVVGNVPFHANRFHVNLKNSMTGNIALHINPRFKEGALVRNTLINGAWGSEERHVHTMPFSPGQAFHMEITNLMNNYKVTVNGQAIFDYIHRIPPGQVDQLEIAGDVILSCVQY